MNYTPENFKDTIVEYVSKMDIAWFSKKEKEFKAHVHYDKVEDLIIIHVKDYIEIVHDVDEDGIPTSSDIEDNSYDIKINLRQYCSLYLPIDEITDWGGFPVDEWTARTKVSPSNNIDEFASDLVKDISSFLKTDSDNVDTYKFISVVLDTTERELNTLKSKNTGNADYIAVLDDFFKRCASIIYRKYSRELTFYKMMQGHVGKLEFSVNQDQMLAILFILQRAGFFTYTDNTTLLRFALDHFLYKDEKGNMVNPSSMKNLQKKLSDIAASQSPKSKQDISHKGLNEVEKTLKDILSKLQ